MEETVAAEREWIPLGEFARRLGLARASVYGRIKRGTLEAKRGNRGGYLVQWPPPSHDGSGDVVGDVALQGHNQSRNSSATVVGNVAWLQPSWRSSRNGWQCLSTSARIWLSCGWL